MSTTAPHSTEEIVQTLEGLLDGIHVAMMTTQAPDGSLHTRPMGNQAKPSLAELWFFTSAHSAKTHEIQSTHEVSLSYAEPKKDCYVAISGTGEVLRDDAKIRELWNPWVEVWFPEGPSDPSIRLVRVIPHRAEYWDGRTTRVAMLYQAAKAALGGKPHRPEGNHGQVKLS